MICGRTAVDIDTPPVLDDTAAMAALLVVRIDLIRIDPIDG